MTIYEAIEARHSVRSYLGTRISEDIRLELEEEITRCNQEGSLHFQLVTDEENAFTGMLAHYGKFTGVRNYIALVGEKRPTLDFDCGYYGERLVLKAQMLGLNTCWVAMTLDKSVVKKHITIAHGEKLCIVIALGYGAAQGIAHQSKPVSKLSEGMATAPEFVKNGLHCAMLAPTAMNQQKFKIICDSEGNARLVFGKSPYARLDSGIITYHYEVGTKKPI